MRCIAITISVCWLASAPAQILKPDGTFVRDPLDRRDLREPDILIESGGRTSTADMLRFTKDEKFLVVCGEDKVVRIWPVDDKGIVTDRKQQRVLFWPVWREQRGEIYAFDLSPDAEQRYVAVGGRGVVTSCVMVLDRKTGRAKAAHYPPDTAEATDSPVRSIAFRPVVREDGVYELTFGLDDGSVWHWQTDQAFGKRVGTHPTIVEPQTQMTIRPRIRAVAFQADGSILSVAELGTVRVWDPHGKQPVEEIYKHDSRILRAAIHQDSGIIAFTDAARRVGILNLRDRRVRTWQVSQPGVFPRNIALAPDGKTLILAVGTRRPGSDFFIDDNDRLYRFDLTAATLQAEAGPSHPYRVEAIAVDSRGRVAVAGGENHEVTLRPTFHTAEPTSRALGVGRAIWGLRLSKDGKRLAIQHERHPTSLDPNKRGSGPWRVFHLERRGFEVVKETAADFWSKPFERLGAEEEGGWEVVADPKNQYRWRVRRLSDQALFDLPWNIDRNRLPNCFAFVPARVNTHPRLLVGHAYGVTLYDLTPGGPVIRRYYIGHTADVTALAVDANGEWFISGGTDQTISAWTLPRRNEANQLGIETRVNGDALSITRVEEFSPAWEAGLLPGDRLLLVANGTKVAYNRSPLRAAQNLPPGTAEAGANALRTVVPGDNLLVALQRPGQDETVRLAATSLRSRPLWRFFPTVGTDWVLWMWQGGWYASSINGDSLIGWLQNDPDEKAAPSFYVAERLKERFHRPNLIASLIAQRDPKKTIAKALNDLREANLDEKQKQLGFARLLPPTTTLILDEQAVRGDQPIVAQVIVDAHTGNTDSAPQRVELWINDYRMRTWTTNGQVLNCRVALHPSYFRSGTNQISLLSFNRAGVRGEAFETVLKGTPEKDVKLRGLLIGINNYQQSAEIVKEDGSRSRLVNLKFAENDVSALVRRWSAQKGALYSDTELVVLSGGQADRAGILKMLKTLAERSKIDMSPDDRLLILLSGHGDYVDDPHRPGEKMFVFCCPDYDRARYRETGITSVEFYDALSEIRCRKFLILDACHSGEAATGNPIRDLTPSGQGPTIIASCDQNELSWENPNYQHGLFTYALLEALGPKGKDADEDGNDHLDAGEIFAYIRKRLPELLKDIEKEPDLQNPQMYPSDPPPAPLAKPIRPS